MNFHKFYLKLLRLATLWRLGSSLVHLITVDGKKFFSKKLFFVWNRVNLPVFLVLYFEYFVGIRLKKQTCLFSLKIL